MSPSISCRFCIKDTLMILYRSEAKLHLTANLKKAVSTSIFRSVFTCVLGAYWSILDKNSPLYDQDHIDVTFSSWYLAQLSISFYLQPRLVCVKHGHFFSRCITGHFYFAGGWNRGNSRGKKSKRAILLFYLDFTDNTVGRFVNQKINDGRKLGRLEKVFAPYQKMHYSKAKTALKGTK